MRIGAPKSRTARRLTLAASALVLLACPATHDSELGTSTVPSPEPATPAPSIRGTLLGHDGSTLSVATVDLSVWEGRRLAWLHPDASGRFELDSAFRGYVRVSITAPGHELLRFGLLLDGTPLEITARLGTYAWLDNPSQIQASARFGRDGHRRQVDFTKQPDGTWTATVTQTEEERAAVHAAAAEPPTAREPDLDLLAEPAVALEMKNAVTAFWGEYQGQAPTSDELSYSISGMTREEGWWIDGTQADRHLAALGYQSVIDTDGRTARIVFDPAALPPGGQAPAIDVRPPTAAAAAVAGGTMLAPRWRMMLRPTTGRSPTKEEEQAQLTAMLADVRREMEAAPAGLGRNAVGMQGLVLATWNLRENHPAYRALAQRLVDALEPADPLWSMSRHAMRRALDSLEGDAAVEAYCERAIAEQSDPEVAATLIVGRLAKANAAGDLDAARTEWTLLHQGRVSSTRAARHAGTLNPDRPSAPGKPVPAFSLPSLDDPNVRVTQETMAGRPYVIDLWATWCSPCVGEMDDLHRGYAALHEAHGVEFLSISFDDHPQSVVEFRESRWPMPWKHAMATTKEDREALRAAFSSGSLPTHIFVAADGTVVADSPQLTGGDWLEIVTDHLEE